MVGNRIFITILNLLNGAWNTPYFNNKRVLKGSAPKNLFRMVKKQYSSILNQWYTDVATREVASHKTQFLGPERKFVWHRPHKLCPCQGVICPPLIPVT